MRPRAGGLEYRATVAQWHAKRSARRPKATKLAGNAALRSYVERQARRRCAHQLRQPGSQVHRIMERGVGMDRDRIDDGRRHGVQNKSPDA